MVEGSVFLVKMSESDDGIGDYEEHIVAVNAAGAIEGGRQLHPSARVVSLEETVHLAYVSNAITGV